MKKLSVIMPTLNRHTHLESVFKFYERWEDVELICVDGSEKAFPKNTPDNVVYISIPSTSFQYRWIQGMYESRGKYLTYMPDDDYPNLRWMLESCKDLNSDIIFQGDICVFDKTKKIKLRRKKKVGKRKTGEAKTIE